MEIFDIELLTFVLDLREISANIIKSIQISSSLNLRID